MPDPIALSSAEAEYHQITAFGVSVSSLDLPRLISLNVGQAKSMREVLDEGKWLKKWFEVDGEDEPNNHQAPTGNIHCTGTWYSRGTEVE